jgi:hypothetical protein
VFYSTSGLIDDISNAVKSEKPLPTDPIAKALMTNAIRNAAVERPSAIGGTPDFEGDKVTVNFEDSDGVKAELHGR